jgi:hypothetical protein
MNSNSIPAEGPDGTTSYRNDHLTLSQVRVVGVIETEFRRRVILQIRYLSSARN